MKQLVLSWMVCRDIFATCSFHCSSGGVIEDGRLMMFLEVEESGVLVKKSGVSGCDRKARRRWHFTVPKKSPH